MITEKFACPCCGYKTFHEKPDGTYSICTVCYWEDDPFQLENPDYISGANRVSLRQAQINFENFGACEKEMIKYVRQPGAHEARNKNWKLID
ncbi:CPCC family cysteine-rich protein [Flavobacterium sp.]|uniref:CPCC family cysteine-rich protein n=1 Tax=Flavobacterium sp. TaxID=239 RepID=UPI0039E39B24